MKGELLAVGARRDQLERQLAHAGRPDGAAPAEHGVALPFEGQSAKRSLEAGDPSRK